LEAAYSRGFALQCQWLFLSKIDAFFKLFSRFKYR
jgi:hypothetical protein